MEGEAGNVMAFFQSEATKTHLQCSLPSLELKPLNDPDSPPRMSLVDASTLDCSDSETDNNFSLPFQQNPTTGNIAVPVGSRFRAHSADWQHSILGFLNRKIRERVMSQQLKSHIHF